MLQKKKYASVLNISGFWICLRFWICLWLWIYWGSEIYQGPEYVPGSEASRLCSWFTRGSCSDVNKLTLRHWNTGLVSSRASFISWGESASLALVGDPSTDGVTIKMPYGVDVLHRPASHPIFSYWVGWHWIWLYC